MPDTTDTTRTPYVPGRTVGGPTPQTNPEMFNRVEIVAEVRYLMWLNRQNGTHPGRMAAIRALDAVLAARTAAEPASLTSEYDNMPARDVLSATFDSDVPVRLSDGRTVAEMLAGETR